MRKEAPLAAAATGERESPTGENEDAGLPRIFGLFATFGAMVPSQRTQRKQMLLWRLSVRASGHEGVDGVADGERC